MAKAHQVALPPTKTGGNRDSTLSGATTNVDGDEGANDDASTKGVVWPEDPSQADLTASEISMIKISTESACMNIFRILG